MNDCHCRFTHAPNDPCDTCKSKMLYKSFCEIKDAVFIYVDVGLLHREAPMSRSIKFVGRKDRDIDLRREQFLAQIVEK